MDISGQRLMTTKTKLWRNITQKNTSFFRSCLLQTEVPGLGNRDVKRIFQDIGKNSGHFRKNQDRGHHGA